MCVCESGVEYAAGGYELPITVSARGSGCRGVEPRYDLVHGRSRIVADPGVDVWRAAAGLVALGSGKRQDGAVAGGTGSARRDQELLDADRKVGCAEGGGKGVFSEGRAEAEASLARRGRYIAVVVSEPALRVGVVGRAAFGDEGGIEWGGRCRRGVIRGGAWHAGGGLHTVAVSVQYMDADESC
jgi:hypothetical protein